MENFENKISEMKTDPPPVSIDNSKRSGEDWLTYALIAVFVVIGGAWILAVGLPLISIASAAPVTTNSVIFAPSNGNNAGAAFQDINLTVDNGWLPSSFVVKTGVPVRWNVYLKQFGGCINGLLVPELGINYRFEKVGETKTFEFTPTKAGTIYFTCLMQMARGQIIVRDDVTISGAAATNTAAANDPAKKVGGCGCGGGGSGGSCGA